MTFSIFEKVQINGKGKFQSIFRIQMPFYFYEICQQSRATKLLSILIRHFKVHVCCTLSLAKSMFQGQIRVLLGPRHFLIFVTYIQVAPVIRSSKAVFYFSLQLYHLFLLSRNSWSKIRMPWETCQSYIQRPPFGVDFTNILLEALTCADPKSAKIQPSCQSFALLGYTVVKAARTMQVKSTTIMTIQW